MHIYSFRHNIFLNKFVERFFVFDNCLLLVASTKLQKYLEVPKTSNALRLFITGFSRKLLIKICENVIPNGIEDVHDICGCRDSGK